MNFLNKFNCPHCRQDRALPVVKTKFKCPGCGASLRSNAIGAVIGALLLGSLPLGFMEAFGTLGAVAVILVSIAFIVILWRAFLNVRVQVGATDDA